LVREEITIPRHQRHETVVLLIKPAEEQPDLLTSTFHVCQGAVEVTGVTKNWENGEYGLQVALEKAGTQFGELLFTVPDGWQATGARVDGRQRRLTTSAPSVVRLGLSLSGTATVDVGFKRDATHSAKTA
jgi:hypothetical protein